MNRSIVTALLACVLLLPSFASAQKETFSASGEHFMLNGKPFQIISGEMHYLRIPPEYWRDRLLKAKAMGLNTVATYVFWNSHEPAPGSFNFEGGADLAKFIRTAQEVGLYVILRPGPYACAEWEFGGYPAWLLKTPPVTVRSMDGRFLAASERYLKRLGQEVAGLQITHGGPILMVQVENEYGSYGADKIYIGRIRDMIKAAGFDVPLFTADGPTQMANGSLPDVLPAINGATGQDIFDTIRKFRPEGPFFVAEFYPGWLDHWGEAHAKVDAAETAVQLDWMLSHGASVNFYMFHGGTNFGFMNGANYGGRFQPQPTSYDYDAPLDEAGRPTKKYFVYRNVIAKYLPKGQALSPVPEPRPSIEIPPVVLESRGMKGDGWFASIKSDTTLSMEDIGQSYGYALYRTIITTPGTRTVVVNGVRDYAVVGLDEKRVGSIDRRYKERSLRLDIGKVPVSLDILVENGGRINYGREILDNRKGIIGPVTLDGEVLRGWEMSALPMDTMPSVSSWKGIEGAPGFYFGSFRLERTGDTYLDMRGWGKGTAWVNGHALGRYWYIGPQQTLFVPGVWLKAGENVITLFELEQHLSQTVAGLREPILDQLQPDKLAPAPPKRALRAVRLLPTDLVREGSFVAGDEPQDRTIAAVKGRYVCLASTSSLAADPFASMSEFYLLDASGAVLPRSTWKVFAVDSEELTAEDGHAENAFDGDKETIWHTQWGSAKPPHPHYLVIDLGEQTAIGGFRYQSRIGNSPGKIKDFQFYVRQQPFEAAE